MNIIQRETDHCEPRHNDARPSILIMHYTETIGPQKADGYFRGKIEHPTGGRVSTHYMIDEDGTIVQYVDESMRAWHAGVSYWDGIEDINSHSIGIELVNPGRKHGYRAFRPAQMMALIELAKDIMNRHEISPHRVLGHSDIAPERKSDPGELFDWKMLSALDVGIWPTPSQEDYKIANDYVRDPQNLKDAFIRAGYDPKANLTDLITAFQRHYTPEVFSHSAQGNGNQGEIDRNAAARLNWLIRHKPTR
jgi:N-acetylmuramoyl-L-alanine amidase